MGLAYHKPPRSAGCKIVEAAAPIFNRHGNEGSSLADVMAATGLKKGGIYRHFSSKEELAAEAFHYTWEDMSLTQRRKSTKEKAVQGKRGSPCPPSALTKTEREGL